MAFALRTLVLAVLLGGSGRAHAQTIVGRARALDGDTLLLGHVTVRLFGIDAPELDQTCTHAAGDERPCGQAARTALAAMIEDRDVTCEGRDRDAFHRVVAVCRTGDTELNAALARAGWAYAYRSFSRDYLDEELAARTAGRGIWSLSSIPPWRWRRAHPRSPSPRTAEPTACRIKGNINVRGERIYHVPGGRLYDATRIDPGLGEQMFCSEPEAQRAGFRRSRQ